MASPLSRLEARIAGQLARERMDGRFAAQVTYETAPVAGQGLVRVDGQLVPAALAEDAAGMVAVANVGRPAAALYSPQGGAAVVVAAAGSGTVVGGVTDHSQLTGLGRDDHAHYLNVPRGDARYYTKEQEEAWRAAHVGDPDVHHKRVTAVAPLSVDAEQKLALVRNVTMVVDGANKLGVNLAHGFAWSSSHSWAEGDGISSAGQVIPPGAGPGRGWSIVNPAGGDATLTIPNILVGSLHAQTFIADTARADVGEEIWTRSRALLYDEFTTPALNGEAPLTVEVPPGLDGGLFKVFGDGHFVRLRLFDTSQGLTIADVWGRISYAGYAYTPADTVNRVPARQTYTYQHLNGPAGAKLVAGTLALSYGAPGDSVVLLTTVKAGAPYTAYYRWGLDTATLTSVDPAAVPWEPVNWKLLARVGSLEGQVDTIFGTGALTGAGLYAENVYLKGRIQLAADSTVSWSNIGGPGRPQDNATYGATWTQVTGAGKPEDNATFGATWEQVREQGMPARFHNQPDGGPGLYMTGEQFGYWRDGWKVYLDIGGNFIFSDAPAAQPVNGSTRLGYFADQGILGGKVYRDWGWHDTWWADNVTGALNAGEDGEVILHNYGLSMVAYQEDDITPVYNTKSLAWFRNRAAAIENRAQAQARIWGGYDIDEDVAASSNGVVKSMLQLEVGVGVDGRIDSDDRGRIALMTHENPLHPFYRQLHMDGWGSVNIRASSAVVLDAPSVQLSFGGHEAVAEKLVPPLGDGASTVGLANRKYSSIHVSTLYADTVIAPAFTGQNTVGTLLSIGAAYYIATGSDHTFGGWTAGHNDGFYSSGSRLTADQAGWYRISYAVQFSSVERSVWVRVNGAYDLWRTRTVEQKAVGGGDLYLNAGEYVELHCGNNPGGTSGHVATFSMVRSGTMGSYSNNAIWTAAGDMYIRPSSAGATSVRVESGGGGSTGLIVQGMITSLSGLINGVNLAQLANEWAAHRRGDSPEDRPGLGPHPQYLLRAEAGQLYATQAALMEVAAAGGGGNAQGVLHNTLLGLAEGDPHSQYVGVAFARAITAQHSFAPPVARPAFVLGPNAAGQLIPGLNAQYLGGHQWDEIALTPAEVLASLLTTDGAGSGLDADLLDGFQGAAYARSALTIGAGDGLQGGGPLTANLTLAVNETVARSTWAVNAGAGLTGGGNLSSTGITLTVGAGTLISVAADAISLANGTAQHQVPVTGASPFAPAWTALSSFAGKAITFAGGAFDIVPGEGLEIETDAIGLKAAVAGNGLTYTSGVIAVGTSGLGLSTTADAVVLESSSNPGAQARILATDATGQTTFKKLSTGVTVFAESGTELEITGSKDLDFGPTIRSGSNWSITSAGALSMKSGAFGGSVDITDGGDLSVAGSGSYAGSPVLFADASGGSVGILCVPDSQFALDINGPARAAYWIGPHAIQLKDVLLLAHYDGRAPFETNFSGDPNAHMGQVGTATGGVIFRPGKFGKAVQIAGATTNLIVNPSFEVDLTGWTWFDNEAANPITPGLSRYGSHAGTWSVRLANNAANQNDYLSQNISGLVPGATYTVSAWVSVTSFVAPAIYSYGLHAYEVEAPTTRYTTSITGNTGGWVRHSVTFTLSAGTGTRTIQVRLYAPQATVLWDAVQCEQSSFATPYCDGSLGGYSSTGAADGTGHFWTGTPHASTSTRRAAVLSYPPAGNINPTRWTVMAWVMVAGYHSGNQTIFRTSGSTSGHIILRLQNGYFVAFSGATYAAGPRIEPGVWTHVAGTYEAGTVRLYVNGALAGSTATGALDGLTVPLYVGCYGAVDFLNGWIDDLCVVDAALPANAILSIYESDAPVFAEASRYSFRATPKSLVWADDEGLWMRDTAGNAVFGIYGGEAASKSWGGQTLGVGDLLIGRGTNSVWWKNAEATVYFSGDGSGLTSIDGGNIQAGTITANKLAIQAGGDNLIYNASFEADSNGDGIADSWASYNNTAGAQPSTLSLVPGRLTGTLAQRVTWTVANTTTKGVVTLGSQERKAGVWYCVSWWAKADTNAAVGFDTRHNTYPNSTEWILQPTPAIGVWQRWAKRMRWDADVTDRLYLSITGGAAVTGSVDFDDVMFYEGDTLQSYMPRVSEILPGTVLAEHLYVDSLSAISANLGAVTAGSIVVGNATNKLWLNDAGDGGLVVGGLVKASAPYRVAADGAFTSTKGTVGGWTISSDRMSATNLLLVSGAANVAHIEVGSGSNVAGLNAVAAAGDIAFWAGGTYVNRAAAETKYRVTAAGKAYLLDAEVEGKVTAASGEIGGWAIASDRMSATNLLLVSGAANVAHIEVGTGSNVAGINAVAAAGDIAFWAGGTYANRAAAGTKYRVTAGGKAYLLDAEVTGKITVTSGNAATTTYVDTGLSGKIGVGGAAADVNAGTTEISGGKIVTGSITASKLNVDSLSAICANLGSVNAGNGVVNLDNEGIWIQTSDRVSDGILVDTRRLVFKSHIDNQTTGWLGAVSTAGSRYMELYTMGSQHQSITIAALSSNAANTVNVRITAKSGTSETNESYINLNKSSIVLNAQNVYVSDDTGLRSIWHAGNLVSPLDRSSFNGDFRSANPVYFYNLAATAYQGIVTQYVNSISGNSYGPLFSFYNGDGSAWQTVKAASFFTVGGGIYSDSAIVALTSTGNAQAMRVGSLLTSSNYAHSNRVHTNGIYSLGNITTSGSISSYDSDFYIGRAGVSKMGMFIWGTYIYGHLTMDDVFAIMDVQAAEPATPASGVKLYLITRGAQINLEAKFANGKVKTLANNL